MAITPFTVYLIGQLDGIVQICRHLALFSLVITVVLSAVYIMCRTDPDMEHIASKALSRVLTVVVCIWLVSTIASVAVPRSQTAAAMFVLPPIFNGLDAQQIPENAVKQASKRIQELIGETK